MNFLSGLRRAGSMWCKRTDVWYRITVTRYKLTDSAKLECNHCLSYRYWAIKKCLPLWRYLRKIGSSLFHSSKCRISFHMNVQLFQFWLAKEDICAVYWFYKVFKYLNEPVMHLLELWKSLLFMREGSEAQDYAQCWLEYFGM